MFWIYLVNNFILITLFYWYNLRLFNQEEIKNFNCFVLVVLIVFKSLLNLYNSFQINLFLTILTYFIVSYIFFKSSSIKKILFICFFLITSFISEMSTYVFLVELLPLYGIPGNSVLYILIGNSISATILFVIVYLTTKINDIRGMIDSKEIWYFINFPIISIIIIYSIMSSDLLEVNPILYTLISIGIITFNIILCKGFSDIIKSKNLQIENEKLKSQKLHYLLLEEKIDSSKRFIHDFKKHINILNGYVINHEYEKMESYLNNLSMEIRTDEKFVITGNQIIDLSLNANKKLITDNSIDVKYDIKVKDLYPLSEFDFNIIFSNILDNAIESCIRTQGHFVKIKLDKINGLIILKVINPCFKVNTDLETLKINNNEYHGYGIKNIKNIVNKYNGTADFDFDEKNSVFISTVVLEVLDRD